MQDLKIIDEVLIQSITGFRQVPDGLEVLLGDSGVHLIQLANPSTVASVAHSLKDLMSSISRRPHVVVRTTFRSCHAICPSHLSSAPMLCPPPQRATRSEVGECICPGIAVGIPPLLPPMCPRLITTRSSRPTGP